MAEEFVLSDEELKALSSGLFEDAVEERQSIGKDMHLMMKEFTDPLNSDVFTTLGKQELPMMIIQRVIASKGLYDPKVHGRGRYFVMNQWNVHESNLRKGIKGRFAELLKDFGGYMLAFRGGVEWRQAGIAGMGEMDEQQMSIANKLKRG